MVIREPRGEPANDRDGDEMATHPATERVREMSEMICEENAYRFNDHFRIERDDGCGGTVFVGTEHNKTEADAIAKYLFNYHGQRHIVIRNSLDEVRQAKAIRRDTVRVRRREEILKEMGVW